MPGYLLAAQREGSGNPWTARLEETAARLVEQARGHAFTGDRPKAADISIEFGQPRKLLGVASRGSQLLVGRHGEGFLGTSMGPGTRACAAGSVCPLFLVRQEAETL
jgi:hypothetical protein